MTGTMWDDVDIRSARFHLRPIREDDVTQRYLDWFSGRGAAQISRHPGSLDALRVYVRERRNRPDVLFLAIRFAETGLHIGNLKFEPIDHERVGAVMGIFVGDESWQGKGVATETIRAAADWLHDRLGLRYLWLGVANDNLAALQAYQRTGFVKKISPLIPDHPDIQTMELELSRR